MEANLYKIYYRNDGRLDNCFVQATDPPEAVKRFNRLFPKKNIVELKEIPIKALIFH